VGPIAYSGIYEGEVVLLEKPGSPLEMLDCGLVSA
jgi:hypothetical protein